MNDNKENETKPCTIPIVVRWQKMKNREQILREVINEMIGDPKLEKYERHIHQNVALEAMKRYALQYRMCALGDTEEICQEQCFTCSEDEALDLKNLHKAHVMQRSEQLVCEQCGKDASDGYRTVTGNVCLGCSGL